MAAAAVLAWAPDASATEYGSACAAIGASTGASIYHVETKAGGHSAATTAPGVITKWEVNTTGSAITSARTESLAILERDENDEMKLLANGEPELVLPGKLNEFAAHLAVGSGVYIGVFSTEGLPRCEMSSGSELLLVPGPLKIGESAAWENLMGGVNALAATVEPDTDGDGLGDETQDPCPGDTLNICHQPPASPAPAKPIVAPPAPLGLSLKAKLEGNVVAVQVSGTAKGSASVSDSFRGRPVAGPKTAAVEPGQIGRAYLPLSKAVKQQLASLPRKRHLDLVIEASGQSTGGSTGVDSIEFAVPGRKKPPARRHRHR
jgi:hypothetical protein